MLGFHAYKQAKEDFVSNLSGTTRMEVLNVMSVLPANLCMLYVGRTLLRRCMHQNHSGVVNFALELLCMILPCVLSITVMSDFAGSYVVAAVGAAILVRVTMGVSRVAEARYQGNLMSGRKRFVSVFKAGVMFLTCVAILAVDFKVFPRRFAKTEVFGYSVMDLGVGSAIFAMGVTSPLSRKWPFGGAASEPSKSDHHNATTATGNTKPTRQRKRKRPLLTWTVAAVVIVGTTRMLVTKAIEYQEHVTEYGVHWNFFFTIAALMVFGHLAQELRVCVPVFGRWRVLMASGVALCLFYEVGRSAVRLLCVGACE